MRTAIFALLLSAFITGCSTSKKSAKTPTSQVEVAPSTAEQLPEITFDVPEIDFGRVVKGETRTHDFTFVNSGSAPLIIEIATGCSCTTIDYPTEPILPGEKSKIHIVFDSGKKKLGPMSVDIDVIANTKPLVTTATFNAEVVAK